MLPFLCHRCEFCTPITVCLSAAVAVTSIGTHGTHAGSHNADDRLARLAVRPVHTQLQTRGVGTSASRWVSRVFAVDRGAVFLNWRLRHAPCQPDPPLQPPARGRALRIPFPKEPHYAWLRCSL